MACTLNTILAGEQNACEESFSGIGSRIYIGLVANLTKKPTKADVDESNAEFTADAFAGLNGNLVAWDIEEETGEVTYETNTGGGGFTNKVEVTIRKNMHKVAHDLRLLNNVKFLVFVPAAEGYYVFYSVNGSAKIDSATGTTGKASSDEHGHTITITAGPMYYPMMTWVPGIDLDDWAKPEADSTQDYTLTYTDVTGLTVSCEGLDIASGTKIPGGSTVKITNTNAMTSVKISVGGVEKTLELSEDNLSTEFVITGNTTLTVS